ncbi:uncharacterized protein EV420DRAFT_1620887 [Desarmillaria tabescens]|uniref:Uncharacterized protein n=1 Tax=Armillaria tabescens TaxID=1929756 RepID=A0AA39N547_ARMTA|nr:uncharacterized protein EV420DRAFT_1620887 [Desarmillaria tabescens]KAK0457625.1 hypothetical protein EV420DRAFT_1620887 [Desarmillaria tabescens]
MKKWSASAYAFFHPVPAIEYHHDRKCHIFTCAAKGCKHVVAQYLDTMDKESTGNMCAGVQMSLIWLTMLRITMVHGRMKMFEWLKGKGAVMYSHCSHTKTETCLHPFNIVKDHRFLCLMKTGHPSYYLPHPTTVSCDVKIEYDGELSFATDAWTLPNYQAFVAFTVHFIHNDFMEISKVHGTHLQWILIQANSSFSYIQVKIWQRHLNRF